MDVLVVDVGGTHVKVFASGQTESVRLRTGVALETYGLGTQRIANGWSYDVMSIGYPQSLPAWPGTH